MRAFIAVEIPETVRKKVTELIDAVRGNLPIKWVEFQNLHITIKFLGEVPEEMVDGVITIADQSKKNFKPFEMSLENLGCFPDQRNPRVVWIGVQDGKENLVELQKRLDVDLAALKFEPEKRFHAHLTIGRTKARCDVSGILEKKFLSERFLVKGFTLIKSTLTPQGPIYDAVKTFYF